MSMFGLGSIKTLALSLLPVGVLALVEALRNKDVNRTGADDTAADVLQAFTPVLPSLVDGSIKDGAAMLHAMRMVEETAHNYRVQQNDPTLQQ